MFYQLGVSTFYGPNIICDLAELAPEMLPYTKETFEGYFKGNEKKAIESSKVWYQERTDFSKAAVGTKRIEHKERHGYECIHGIGVFEGKLLGGCLESLYQILSGTRFEDQVKVCNTYGIFPTKEQWKDCILFIETCEEQPTPEQLEEELLALKEKGVFEVVNGILVGKPMDELYYDEYKQVYQKVLEGTKLPVLYNINFGHSVPRCALPYGVRILVDMDRKEISLLESAFN